MLHISTTKRSLGLWASALCLLAACDDSLVTPNPDPASVTMPTCGGMPAEVLSGTITQNKTLTADKRWLLSGQVKVTQKATLTIEPGTTVCGDATDPQKVSFLNIDQDAKLVADGSREKPIVFTSSRKPGERRTSDWGGVVLRGRAPINLPPGDASACGSLEGNAGSYGPCGTLRSDDSSGVLRYVRIEFAGREVAPDNELNGLTLGGVGSGTVIDYVQVHRGSDDAFEFFGGTVNVRHLVATGALDDSFDWDQGYSGKGQFLVSQQILADGNNGIEADNNRDNNSLMPRSSPVFSNVTLIGTGAGSSPKGEKRLGMTLRQGTDGIIQNVIVLGFTEMGVTMTQDSTCTELASGKLTVKAGIFFDNGRDATANLSSVTTPCDVAAALRKSGNREVNPQLRRPYAQGSSAPDFRPQTSSPALTDAAQQPTDAFFTAAPYLGAFGPADGDDWTQGWTSFPEN
ncbi:MAG TPA: hypothetical protein PKI49_16090 [Pseudomonadota bacterium]|nr:hypothetical protein [Pseudomonadota bacterium]